MGSLTRLPRAQTGSWVPAVAGRADVCRAAAGSQLRHAWLCPVSPGTDPDIPCSWLFVLSANCWHAVGLVAGQEMRAAGTGGLGDIQIPASL